MDSNILESRGCGSKLADQLLLSFEFPDLVFGEGILI